MDHSYWNSWYAGWGWFLWIGIWFLMISSFGNWGYTYKVHRRYGDKSQKTAIDMLNERYARGELVREEYQKIKDEITSSSREAASELQQRKVTHTPSPA